MRRMKFAAVVLGMSLVNVTSGEAQSFQLTVENIMRGPDLYGTPPADIRDGDALRPWLAPLAANFVLLLALGLTLPAPLVAALEQVLRVLRL